MGFDFVTAQSAVPSDHLDDVVRDLAFLAKLEIAKPERRSGATLEIAAAPTSEDHGTIVSSSSTAGVPAAEGGTAASSTSRTPSLTLPTPVADFLVHRLVANAAKLSFESLGFTIGLIGQVFAASTTSSSHHHAPTTQTWGRENLRLAQQRILRVVRLLERQATELPGEKLISDVRFLDCVVQLRSAVRRGKIFGNENMLCDGLGKILSDRLRAVLWRAQSERENGSPSSSLRIAAGTNSRQNSFSSEALAPLLDLSSSSAVSAAGRKNTVKTNAVSPRLVLRWGRLFAELQIDCERTTPPAAGGVLLVGGALVEDDGFDLWSSVWHFLADASNPDADFLALFERDVLLARLPLWVVERYFATAVRKGWRGSLLDTHHFASDQKNSSATPFALDNLNLDSSGQISSVRAWNVLNLFGETHFLPPSPKDTLIRPSARESLSEKSLRALASAEIEAKNRQKYALTSSGADGDGAGDGGTWAGWSGGGPASAEVVSSFRESGRRLEGAPRGESFSRARLGNDPRGFSLEHRLPFLHAMDSDSWARHLAMLGPAKLLGIFKNSLRRWKALEPLQLLRGTPKSSRGPPHVAQQVPLGDEGRRGTTGRGPHGSSSSSSTHQSALADAKTCPSTTTTTGTGGSEGSELLVPSSSSTPTDPTTQFTRPSSETPKITQLRTTGRKLGLFGHSSRGTVYSRKRFLADDAARIQNFLPHVVAALARVGLQ